MNNLISCFALTGYYPQSCELQPGQQPHGKFLSPIKIPAKYSEEQLESLYTPELLATMPVSDEANHISLARTLGQAYLWYQVASQFLALCHQELGLADLKLATLLDAKQYPEINRWLQQQWLLVAEEGGIFASNWLAQVNLLLATLPETQAEVQLISLAHNHYNTFVPASIAKLQELGVDTAQAKIWQLPALLAREVWEQQEWQSGSEAEQLNAPLELIGYDSQALVKVGEADAYLVRLDLILHWVHAQELASSQLISELFPAFQVAAWLQATGLTSPRYTELSREQAQDQQLTALVTGMDARRAEEATTSSISLQRGRHQLTISCQADRPHFSDVAQLEELLHLAGLGYNTAKQQQTHQQAQLLVTQVQEALSQLAWYVSQAHQATWDQASSMVQQTLATPDLATLVANNAGYFEYEQQYQQLTCQHLTQHLTQSLQVFPSLAYLWADYAQIYNHATHSSQQLQPVTATTYHVDVTHATSATVSMGLALTNPLLVVSKFTQSKLRISMRDAKYLAWQRSQQLVPDVPIAELTCIKLQSVSEITAQLLQQASEPPFQLLAKLLAVPAYHERDQELYQAPIASTPAITTTSMSVNTTASTVDTTTPEKLPSSNFTSYTQGYNYLTDALKYVVARGDYTKRLKAFYHNPHAQGFIPLVVDNSALDHHQALANSWSATKFGEGIATNLQKQAEILHSISLFKLFQSLLADTSIAEDQLIVFTNINAEFASDWLPRLNHSLNLNSFLIPFNKMIWGSVPTTEHQQLGQQLDAFTSVSLQLLQAQGIQIDDSIDLSIANWQLDHFDAEQLVSSQYALYGFNPYSQELLIFRKRLVRDIVKKLRQNLLALTPNPEQLSEQELAALLTDNKNIPALQQRLALKQQLEATQAAGQAVASADYDPLYLRFRVAQNTINGHLITGELQDFPFPYLPYDASQAIIPGMGEQSHVPMLSRIPVEQLRQRLESLAAEQGIAFRFNTPLTQPQQLVSLVDITQLTDGQVLSLALPLYPWNFMRLTDLFDFSSYSIIIQNPPLVVSRHRDYGQADAQINQALYGMGKMQQHRLTRREQQRLTHIAQNPQLVPDTMAHVRKFVINLPQSPERLDAIFAQEHTQDFEVVEAVYGKALTPEQLQASFDVEKFYQVYHRQVAKGEIGCTLSHMKIYQQVLNDPTIKDDDWVMVTEDDSKFFPDWYERLNQLLYYFQQHPEINPKFLLCANNWLLKNEPLSYDQLENVTYFSCSPDDVRYINSKQGFFFPFKIVSYGSSHYLFKKSLLQERFFKQTVRPFWVADDFPQFLHFKPHEYAYCNPMLSYQEEEFNSVINDEREELRQKERYALRSKSLYLDHLVNNYLTRSQIIIQWQLTKEQIQQQYPDATYIVLREDLDQLSNEQLWQQYYDQEAYLAHYDIPPTREQMLRAILHQRAYQFIASSFVATYNYYLIIEDHVMATSADPIPMANLVLNYLTTRLSTVTQLIELSNSFYDEYLELAQGDPTATGLNFNCHQFQMFPHYYQGQSATGYDFCSYKIQPGLLEQVYIFPDDLEENEVFGQINGDPYAQCTPESYQQALQQQLTATIQDQQLITQALQAWQHPLAHESYLNKRCYRVNEQLDIDIVGLKAQTVAYAYLILSYPIIERQVGVKKISWQVDDFTNIINFHPGAFAYTNPPLFIGKPKL